MRKQYKASRGLSINVVVGKNTNVHVAFEGRSDGSSYYATDDADLQHAIEHNCHFGHLFFLDSAEDEQVSSPSPEVTPDAPSSEQVVVEVTDIDEAKDYLAEKYGISRTMLRSKSAILSEGESRGITFRGI